MKKTKIPAFTLVRRTPISIRVAEEKLRPVVGQLSTNKRVLAGANWDKSDGWSKAAGGGGEVRPANSRSLKVGQIRAAQALGFAMAVAKPVAKHILARQARRLKVGILDLGAWLSELPKLVEALNKAQNAFEFAEIQAPVPGGLLKTSSWYATKGYQLSGEKKELNGQFYANDFFQAGAGLLGYFKIDYLVGLTPALLAGEHGDQLYWNHFASGDRKVMAVSTAELRKFAAQSGIPFEAFVAHLIIGQVLVNLNPELGFHSDTGCLFDYNESRVSLIESVKNPKIDPGCMARIEPRYRAPAQAFLKLLEAMRRG